MADRSEPGPRVAVPVRETRWGGFVVIVLVGISLAFHLVDWWAEGQPSWRGLINSVGVGLLGLALVVGRQRRRTYNALIGVSLALVVLSLGLTILRRW